MSLSSSPHRRGAPPGNSNAFKHGFYSRRIKKAHLSGVETTNSSGLIEEIALIRVFTRRLIESLSPEADPYEIAETLRILCLASSTITRVVKAQVLISSSGSNMPEELALAIREVNAELRRKDPPPGEESSTTPIQKACPDQPLFSLDSE